MAPDVTRDDPLTAEEHGDTEAYVRGFSPSEKRNPNLRREDQDMELAPRVVGPPAYSSPDPRTNDGRLVTVEEHPLADSISEDYGQGRHAAGPTDHIETPKGDPEGGAKASSGERPENREEWNKSHWQSQAKEYDLTTSGTAKEIQKRVEDYEGELDADKEMKASDWTDEIDKAESADDLASIKSRYETAGADFATVASAFEKKESEFAEDDDETPES